MTLGERIKTLRTAAGMSQEKLAEQMGVSRQAVTKWERGQSAPSTEKLFQLAELFGTSVDLLLREEVPTEKVLLTPRRKKWMLWALGMVGVYLFIYLLGRIIWVDRTESTVLGWLIFAQPAGENSYLYGWLTHGWLFWMSMAISALPMLWGKWRFSAATLAGFVVGFGAGMVFGPYPAGEAYGHGHYGWAIWGGCFLVSIVLGVIWQKLRKKVPN